jgi:hypothetical protein
VFDWTVAVLNRVDRPSFFSQFDEGHTVQYFYEPFLKAFDPQLRKDLGIWFTPPEIVHYMVVRVDTVLRQEFKIADGLGRPPGLYPGPVLQHRSLSRGSLKKDSRHLAGVEDALTAQDLKATAQERVFGFEILPAPLVESHLQLGLLLQNLGAPLLF